MRITILTVGTRGDVQPYLALACGLQQDGHDVTVATGADFERVVVDRNLRHRPIGIDFTTIMKSETWARFHRAGLLGKARIIKNEFGPLVERVLNDSWPAAQDAEAIIYDQSVASGRHLAEKLGVPACLCGLIPSLEPTRQFPHPNLSFLRCGGYINRLSYGDRSPWYLYFPELINRWRERVLQLPALEPRESDRVLRGEPIPLMYAFSPNVIPPPDDWGSRAHVTGYWFLDADANWRPPATLLDFLAQGPPPVYIGFGSMTSLEPQAVTQTVVAALAKVGLRGVLATGWGGLTPRQVPDSIYMLESAPHDWLFPRMAAVVHHGGAGTLAAGLRAGKPTVVCPFDLDQPYWGRVVAKLGVGPRPIPQKKLSIARLARALRMATTDAEMIRRASTLGARIRKENGVANAVRLVRQWCVRENSSSLR